VDSDSIDQAVGFYGKLPSKGDFLTRSLPRDFVADWDEWLQTGLNDSREILGSNWLDIYLTSPLWRFTLSPGVCGDTGWAGLMLPSMDRVGRYFPFTIARPLLAQQSPLAAAIGEGSWFSQAAELALAALGDDDKDPADLNKELAAIRIDTAVNESSDENTGPIIAPLDLATGVRLPLGENLDNSRIITSMACAWLNQELEHYSLWWTEGSQIMSPSLLCHPGLPTTAQFCALLDGRWANNGWSDPASSLSLSPEELQEPNEFDSSSS
jgi:type VI secretion system protein ImpM